MRLVLKYPVNNGPWTVDTQNSEIIITKLSKNHLESYTSMGRIVGRYLSVSFAKVKFLSSAALSKVE